MEQIYYCPQCVDEQKNCPYQFVEGTCPYHPKVKLVFDKELTSRLNQIR